MSNVKDRVYYIVIGSVFGLLGRVLYDIIPMTLLRLYGDNSITDKEFGIVCFKGAVGVVMACVLFLLANVLFRKRNNIDSDTS